MTKHSKHLNRRKAGPKHTHKSHKQEKQQRVRDRNQSQGSSRRQSKHQNKSIDKKRQNSRSSSQFAKQKKSKPINKANKRNNMSNLNSNKTGQQLIKEMMKNNNKGKQLFTITPVNDNDQDDFKAIGGVQGDSQQQQYQDQQIDYDGQQYDENAQNQEGQEDMDIQMNKDNHDNQEDQENDQDFQQGQQQNDDQVNGQQKQNQNQQQQQQQQVDCDMMLNQQQQQQDNKQPVDVSVINMHIQQTISILMNIHRLGNGLPRKHYIQKLKQYLHQYYGYNFQLIDHFLNMFTPNQLIQFFQANQTQRPLTIRTNTLKTRRKQLAQALIQRGVNLDPLADWSKVGIKIYQTKVPIGATPQYLAGHYMLQSASSFLPVLALDPQLNQRILDMASAPGGKTTYIAQLMKNTGCVFANDLKKERLRALQFNIYRMGLTNTTITCRDGRKYPQLYPNSFDRVLLDAPCTGLGIISKDHSIKANRVLVDIYKNSHVQKQLLLAAIDCTKVNGVIVYSTCSVSPLQNQQVVNYALKKRFVKIVECDIEVGEQGMTKFVQKRFHPDLKKTRRVYPHVHNMDGFYVAKLVKIGKGKRKNEDKQEDINNEEIQEEKQKQQEHIDNQQEQQILEPIPSKNIKRLQKNKNKK